MKKLCIVALALLCLTGCVEKKPQDTQTAAPAETAGTVAVPSPEDMPEKPPQNTLPPGEDNIPDKTYTQ